MKKTIYLSIFLMLMVFGLTGLYGRANAVISDTTSSVDTISEGDFYFMYNLEAGWNFVSPVITEMIGQPFSKYFTNLESIYSWNGVQYQQATTIESTKGYWVKNSVAENIKVKGTAITTTSYNLTGAGEHLVGAPFDLTMKGVDCVEEVKHYNNDSSSYYIDWNIEQGSAAWVKTDGNCAFTRPGVVTPSITVSNLAATNISTSGATVTWSTNIASLTELGYKKSTSNEWTWMSDQLSTTNHSLTLSNIDPATTYNYQVRVKNSSGAITTQSDIKSLTTLTATQVPPDDDTDTDTDTGDYYFMYNLEAGWNFVSPVITEMIGKTVISYFPHMESFYYWDSGYKLTTTFESGRGYWMKNSVAENIKVKGTAITTTSYNLTGAGEHLVGAPFDLTMKGVDCVEEVKHYNNDSSSYYIDWNIEQGSAAWVKTDGNCAFTRPGTTIVPVPDPVPDPNPIIETDPAFLVTDNYISSPNIFALNGQADKEGPVNYDLYASFNRVISGGRVGTGVEKVKVSLELPTLGPTPVYETCEMNFVNFSNTCGSMSGVNVLSNPSSTQGLLKINMNAKSYASVKFDITYSTTAEPTGYTFNLGDSVGNNAWGGDGGQQSNDSELQIYNTHLSIFGDDDTVGERRLHNIGYYVKAGDVVSITVRNNYAEWSKIASSGPVPIVPPIKTDDEEIEDIRDKANLLYEGELDPILLELKQLKNTVREQEVEIKYLRDLLASVTSITEAMKERLRQFITYGVDDNSSNLGEGERAAVVYAFKEAFGKLPESESDFEDVIKIANGRWPGETSEAAETRAKDYFRKIYLRTPDMNDPHDDAAVVIMAYGLRQQAHNRNLNSEAKALEIFKSIFGKVPETTQEWNILQAITYSGATRAAEISDDVDNDGLSDSDEAVYGTDPKNPDSDGDGYLDGTEVSNGYNPLGTGKLESNDMDNDGLSDSDEAVYGTDPKNPDSDGDGYLDGDEVKNKYNPLGIGKMICDPRAIEVCEPSVDRAPGLLTFSTDENTPASDIILAGTIKQHMASIKFSALNESFKVQDLTISVNTAGASDFSDSIGMVSIEYPTENGNGSAVGYLSSSTIVFTNLGMFVESNQSAELDIFADILTINSGADSGDAGNMGIDASGTFKVLGLASGVVDTDADDYSGPVYKQSDAVGKDMVVRKTKPTVSLVSLPSTTLTNGIMTISKFTVTANAAEDVSLYELEWDYLATGFATGSENILTNAKLYNSATNVELTASSTPQIASSTIKYQLATEEVIPAGTSKTYYLAVTVSGSDGGDLLQTRLREPSAMLFTGSAYGAAINGTFVWSDNSAITHSFDSADWANAQYVQYLPSDYQSLFN